MPEPGGGTELVVVVVLQHEVVTEVALVPVDPPVEACSSQERSVTTEIESLEAMAKSW